MKAILSSAGIATSELMEVLARLVNKPLKDIGVVVINEASAVEPGDKRWHFDEMQRLSQTVGGTIDVINLLALDLQTVEQRMRFADVIYVVGGNTDYLMSVFHRTGFANLLETKLLKNKVYVGSSAGSMVLGRRITTKGYGEIYRKGEQDFSIAEYLSLVNLAIFPHLDSPLFTRNRADIIRGAAQGLDFPVYAIRDTQAVVVDGDSVSSVGGKALILS